MWTGYCVHYAVFYTSAKSLRKYWLYNYYYNFLFSRFGAAMNVSVSSICNVFTSGLLMGWKGKPFYLLNSSQTRSKCGPVLNAVGNTHGPNVPKNIIVFAGKWWTLLSTPGYSLIHVERCVRSHWNQRVDTIVLLSVILVELFIHNSTIHLHPLILFISSFSFNYSLPSPHCILLMSSSFSFNYSLPSFSSPHCILLVSFSFLFNYSFSSPHCILLMSSSFSFNYSLPSFSSPHCILLVSFSFLFNYSFSSPHCILLMSSSFSFNYSFPSFSSPHGILLVSSSFLFNYLFSSFFCFYFPLHHFVKVLVLHVQKQSLSNVTVDVVPQLWGGVAQKGGPVAVTVVKHSTVGNTYVKKNVMMVRTDTDNHMMSHDTLLPCICRSLPWLLLHFETNLSVC